MNLKEVVIDALTDKHDLNKKELKEITDTVFETLINTISSEEKVNFIGLGTFHIKTRPARDGRNPQTQEPIKIPSRKVVTFKVAKTLKEKIANK